jgi:hypothetical protein
MITDEQYEEVEIYEMKHCIIQYKKSANKAWKRWKRQKEDLWPAVNGVLEIIQWDDVNPILGSVFSIEKRQDEWMVYGGTDICNDPRLADRNVLRYYQRLGFRGNHLEDVDEATATEIEDVWFKQTEIPEGMIPVRSTLKQFLKDMKTEHDWR